MPLSLAIALLAACGGQAAATRSERHEHVIAVKGDFRHAASGALFPERIEGLTRDQPYAYDRAERDVSASYVEGGLKITAYVYPAGPASSGRLRAELLKAAAGIEQVDQDLRPTGTRVVQGPSTHALGSGFERTWSGPTAESVERVQVFQCGQWFLKVRASCGAPQAARLEAALAAVQRTLSCAEIATRHPAGTKIAIQMSPDVDDQSAATWLMYGAGLALWMKQHAPPGEPVYGVPDHRHDMFLAGVRDALEIYRQSSARSDARTPEFERLNFIQAAGFLEELVWTWQLGFLDPDPALGLDLPGFQAWLKANPEPAPIAQKSGLAYE